MFLVTSTEVMLIGLLPDISTGFSVSPGVAGRSLFYYGVVAGASAPFMTAATRSQDRKRTLVLILVVFAVGNLLCALSVEYWQFLAARFGTGLLHGLLWAMVGSAALKIAPAGKEVRATTLVFSGISCATVVGVPAGVLIGSAWGWRAAFLALSASCALLALACAVALPAIRPTEQIPLRELPTVLRNPRLLAGLATTLVLVFGYYSSYTYLRPLMSVVAKIPTEDASGALVLFGIAGVAGNFLGGFAIKRAGAALTLFGFGSVCALVLLATITLNAPMPLLASGLLVWGAVYSVLPIALQTFVLQASSGAQEAASSVYVLIFNVAIGAGALAGGAVLDHHGAYAVGFLSVLVLLLGAVCFGAYRLSFSLRKQAFTETYDSTRA